MREYYTRRAPEYDDWYLGTGMFADRDRPGWHAELEQLGAALAAMPGVRTLDVACGTGFLTRRLPGEITGLDQSEAMLEIARERVPDGTFLAGDALELPFPDAAFDRVFTGHFYGHLNEEERARFVAEARRLAPELIIVDSHLQPGHEAEEHQERILSDGSTHRVYKRYFDAAGLARELGGGEVLHEGDWFVAVRRTW